MCDAGHVVYYRRGAEGRWQQVPIMSAEDSSYVLSGLEPATLYQLYVVAANMFGEGDPSELISVKTVHPPEKEWLPESVNRVTRLASDTLVNWCVERSPRADIAPSYLISTHGTSRSWPRRDGIRGIAPPGHGLRSRPPQSSQSSAVLRRPQPGGAHAGVWTGRSAGAAHGLLLGAPGPQEQRCGSLHFDYSLDVNFVLLT
ncbi:COL7A1 [Cordylochernes scorpioides]|uniref:COL7A1 n=1 Tax=Cordylochernes scorpioides TaxID=51811 RepID=A0ABY6K1C7_9ARAC|nr:COL7A1 [Cordylochernes scorpioides]